MTPSAEESVAGAAAKTSIIVGGGTALAGWLSDNLFALLGVAVAAFSALIGWYYNELKRKRAEADATRRQVLADLQEEERRLRIELLRRGLPIPDLPAEPTVPGPLFDAED